VDLIAATFLSGGTCGTTKDSTQIGTTGIGIGIPVGETFGMETGNGEIGGATIGTETSTGIETGMTGTTTGCGKTTSIIHLCSHKTQQTQQRKLELREVLKIKRKLAK
jgi:hypothetical protein